MPDVVITGWSKGLETARCIQLLQSAGGLSTAAAARAIERLVHGDVQRVPARSDADARLLVSALARLGATAHVASGSS